MLDAPEPIYEFLFKFIRDGFLHCEPNDEKPLKRFERGIIYDIPQNVNSAVYPMGYLEWGEISELELFQSPSGYKYDLIYRLCLLTFQKEGTPENAVFTGKTDAPRPVYGIGDLVTKIMDTLWTTHHGGRLAPAGHQQGDNPGRDVDWWVINWVFSVGNKIGPQPGETDLIVSNRSHRSNPLVRGTQINLKFNVFERDPLV